MKGNIAGGGFNSVIRAEVEAWKHTGIPGEEGRSKVDSGLKSGESRQ